VGVPGELCIGGDGLARGYLNRAELTEEKFIFNAFSKEAGARLYRTGDLCRWLVDGNLEYLGRMDEQVKIRGYRIELGEIEAVVQQSPVVKHCVVLAKEDVQGTKRLVGYVVPHDAFDKEALVAYLHQKLPEYMVPQLWMALEQLPLTPNGKVDRKALPQPNAAEQSSKEYVAPRTEVEQKLAAIWAELLGVEKIGIHDNFFELGGHSLLAMRVISYIEKRLLISIPIKVVFKFTTISDLSKYIETQVNISDKNKSAAFKTIDI
jgi:acyl carrier protein